MPNIVSQERFIKEALTAHNNYRQLHHANELEHEPRLSSLAQEWAEILATKGSLSYRQCTYKNEELGENIMRFKLNEANLYYLNGSDVTDEWYNEESRYKYTGKFSSNTGHFTQIVWKSTQKVGFGFCMDDTGVLYVVANYFPAGNYSNKYIDNVSPRTSKLLEATESLPPSSRAAPVPKDDQKRNHFFKDILNNVKNHKTDHSVDSMDDHVEELDESIESTNFNFDQVQTRFINEALIKHNRLRRIHGVQELVHNPELSFIAQGYADRLARMNQMVHSKNKYKDEKIGENLAYKYDSRVDFYSGEDATMQWYDEIYDHNFDLDHQKGTGHFTQLVWKNTREVGFGVSEAKDGSWYAVANYYPAGNFIGRFVQNVPRPL